MIRFKVMSPGSPSDLWQFELYIVGDNRRSELAQENLRGICKDYLRGHCHVDVFDIKKHPELCVKKNICGSPYLIRKYPLPEKRMIGDLSSTDKVLEGFDIDLPGVKIDDKKAYLEGLEKQSLNFVKSHERRQR